MKDKYWAGFLTGVAVACITGLILGDIWLQAHCMQLAGYWACKP